MTQLVKLERHHGSAESLDDVLKAASERLPRVELFWLLRAKERWVAKDIDIAQEILTAAFAANPDSERVWLAAAKLEGETGGTERAPVLLLRARVITNSYGSLRVFNTVEIARFVCKLARFGNIFLGQSLVIEF